MKTFFLGAVVGIGCCYISSMIASVIEKAKFLAWVREQGLEYAKGDADSRYAIEIAYALKDAKNISTKIIHHDKEEFKDSDII